MEDTCEVNFALLEQRLLAISTMNLEVVKKFRKMIDELKEIDKPILMVATGGSLVVAYYLQFVLESLGKIGEVIQPRDYFYKGNKNEFWGLVGVSASGKTNGIKEALRYFQGLKFLVCEEKLEEHGEVIAWGNDFYQKERSFISLVNSLGPITLILESLMVTREEELKDFGEKIKSLLASSRKKIDKLEFDFGNSNIVQIMSEYETQSSMTVLESNLVETGIGVPVIHDKGAFCHGRSNLLLQYPESLVIYLMHQKNKFDELLIKTIEEEYHNLVVVSSRFGEENRFWQEYELILQMYFLTRKMAKSKGVDLTRPDYNPRLVKKLYNYRGEM